MTSLTKNLQPPTKKIFSSAEMADLFDGLNSSLAQSVEELWHW